MEKLQKPILNSILEVINAADESIDIQNLRYKIMDVFFDVILADGIIFLPPDMHKLKGDVLLKNHEEKYIELYKTYYYRLDPFDSDQIRNRAFGVELLENMINYDSFQLTEFYTDFLRPQKIHYILIANLTMDKRMEGTVLLTRSKQSNRFDSDDIKIAKLISPYFCHSLFHNRLRRKVKLLQNIINYLEGRSSLSQSIWQHLMDSFHLSPREVDVVPYLFSGLKNAEIAEKLFVSEITIKKHLQNIYAKMGVRNRTSLINKIVTLNSKKALLV
jgi:DNA-binding CsgD family transcriptional regulator